MIEGNAYAKLVSSESVLEQVKSYPPVSQHVSTETPQDTKQGKEGQQSTKGEATSQATEEQTSQAPSSTENVTTETPRKDSPKATSEAKEIDKCVVSTEQPTKGKQASQAIVLVQPVKASSSKEKKMKKHSFKLDLSKPIVLPNVDISKLKGQALIEFGELCKAKVEQERQMAIQKKKIVLQKVKALLTDMLPEATMTKDAAIHIQLDELLIQIGTSRVDTFEYLSKLKDKELTAKMIEEVQKAIAIGKVKLVKFIVVLSPQLKHILYLFQKLCTFSLFIKDIKNKTKVIEKEITDVSNKLTIEPNSIQNFYTKLQMLMAQQLELRNEEHKIRMDIMTLQTLFIPHLSFVQEQINKATSLSTQPKGSTLDGLISLLANITTQNSLMDSVKDALSAALTDARTKYKSIFD